MSMKSSSVLVLGLGGSGLKVATYVLKGVMETNNNELPEGFALLVADTEQEVQFKVGGWGEKRGRNHATGPVSIGTGRYMPLTGNVKDLGVKIMREQKEALGNPAIRRRQANRHMSSWFQAKHYIEDVNVDDAVWNLDIGAGQFRQFGRLGLFNNVSPRVTTLLSSAIQSIKHRGDASFQVHIIGSFAGGTGAAMFVDFPHLIKEIAKEHGFNQAPTVIGHFLLANAFAGTPQVQLSNPGTRRAFDARSYACLRELTRLQGVSLQRSGGYPVIYDPSSPVGGKLNTDMVQSPYTYAYLYDGVRSRNTLNTLELPEGLAPSIADVIMAYVDGRSGSVFRAHTVNFKAYYGSHNIPTGQVTYGSVGTYTIELPIYHIIEGWSHSLARDVMDTLLMPQADSDGEPLLDGGTVKLQNNMPGGQLREPKAEALKWARQGGISSLVSKLVNWGELANRTSSLHDETAREILSYDEATWQQDLAPSGAEFQDYVTEAHDDLYGSFMDKDSRYFVDHNQGGNSSGSRASNLVGSIDSQMVAMVGRSDGTWKREGGNFRGSLIRLANHHRIVFEDAIVRELNSILNGGSGGSEEEKKCGKLGFAVAFVQNLSIIMQQAKQLLEDAAQMAASERKDTFMSMEQDLKSVNNTMRRQSGFLNRNLKRYRDQANEIAQFHKADIARQVVHDLVQRLVKSLNELQSELKRWITMLAASTSDYGGTYSLLLDGIREVNADRRASKNAARWVIDDQEDRDTYISQKHTRYVEGKLDEILNSMQWQVGMTDGGSMRVNFAIDGNQLDQRAGRRGERPVGLKNLGYLLTACRAVFEPAWTDMTVTQYLHSNFAERSTELAKRVYDASGYLLSTKKGVPPMRSTYMRVYQDGMSNSVRMFLDELLTEIRIQFGDTTEDEKRSDKVAEDKDARAGQNSYDRFKLNFIMFGDLLQPDEISGYIDAQRNYREFSNNGNKWRELQILPAETHALQIEKSLDSSSSRLHQKRRELNAEVVTLLENMERFRLAMRCLTYGEDSYRWDSDGRGLLLYQYTEPKNNAAGLRYWRLTVMPEGELRSDGRLYDDLGQLAQPVHYQLSNMDAEPDLWQALLQLVVARRDIVDKKQIDLARAERTILYAEKTHLAKWHENQRLGWQFNPDRPFDRQLATEGEEKAAKVIRLNAYLDELDVMLKRPKWSWAWETIESASTPKQFDKPELKNRIQRDVDLWTALRWAAQDERHSLGVRLGQLGNWISQDPRDKLRLSSHADLESEAESPQDEPVESGWACESCQTINAEDGAFCENCGTPKPAAPVVDNTSNLPEPVETVAAPEVSTFVAPASSEPPESPEPVDPLANVQALLDSGVISQAEFDKMVQKIRSKPTAEQEAQIQQARSLLDAGLLDQAAFDAMVEKILKPSEPELDDEQLKQIEQARSLLNAGLLNQAEFDAMVAKIRGDNKETLSAEQKAQIKALEGMLNAGLMEQSVFDEKVAQIKG